MKKSSGKVKIISFKEDKLRIEVLSSNSPNLEAGKVYEFSGCSLENINFKNKDEIMETREIFI